MAGTSCVLAGETLTLLPSGAVFWPRVAALLIADAHIGKDHSFRRLGVPVPAGASAGTLASLSNDVATTQTQHIIFLGDLLHSRHAHGPTPMAELHAWREQHAALRCTLVRGNHDDRAGDPPAEMGFETVDEPLVIGPFALCHHPKPRAEGYVLAGHWHPCVHVGSARERLRLACFWFGAAVGVLPAYGEFTGMHPIERRSGDAVWAIAGERVMAVPSA
jgi:uncharacterized protein